MNEAIAELLEKLESEALPKTGRYARIGVC